MTPPPSSGDRPRIVLITGMPGSGKSTLGGELSRALRVPFLSRDDVRGGLFFTAGGWTSRPRRVPSSDEAVEAFLVAVESLAGLGITCILEYVVRTERPHDLERVATVADCRVLHTSCRDASARLARRNNADRLLNKRPVLDALGYASVDQHTLDAVAQARTVALEMVTEFDLPLLKVDTEDGYEPSLDAIIDFVTGDSDPGERRVGGARLTLGVDYQQKQTARRYSKGRSLPDNVLQRWRDAVAPHLPNRQGLRVLDLGAGTGIFARAWPTWCPGTVVALEPAPAMRAELLRSGLPESVRPLAGRAEALPLRSACVDVVWISAVIHHVEDLDRCAAEIARVLIADGTVLVRGLFADLGATPGLELFPGSERAVARFPAVAAIKRAFERHGLLLRSAEMVEDAGPATVGAVADRVRQLRSADTLLQQLTEDEINRGLAAIDAMDPARPLPPAALGLLVLRP